MASAKADPGLEARRGMHLARRVVIKAGTPVVTHCDGKVALGRIGSLVEQVAILRQQSDSGANQCQKLSPQAHPLVF